MDYRIALLTALLAASPAAAEDGRLLVEMPPAAIALMRSDMLAHMAAVDEVVAHLGSGDFAAATRVARSLGTAAMGRHRGSGAAPGRFMPPEMHSLGRRMHLAADDLATAAERKELPAALTALGAVTTQCVLCHRAYRVR